MGSWEKTISAVLHLFWLDTIRRKIIVFSLLATLIPSFTMGWLSYTQSKRLLEAKTTEELRNVTANTAQELGLWLRERQYEAKVFSNSYEVTENVEKSVEPRERKEAIRRLKDYLRSVRGNFSVYEELLAVDRKLKVIASSAKKASRLRLPDDWLSRVKSSDGIVGQPYRDRGKDRGVIVVGAPIKASNGRLLGLLVAKLNFRSIERQLKASPVAETGKVYVVAAEGSVIASSGPLPLPFMETKLEPGIVQTLFNQEGMSLAYSDFEGERVVGTLTKLSPTDWGVIAEVPQATAFAETTDSRNLIVLIASGLLVGIALMAYFLGLSIVRPLDRLASGAATVAAGQLKVDLPVVGHGEVGALTRNFNDMVTRLRKGRDELAASNSALSDRNKELERLSITDGLTGLYNRKHLMETLVHESGRARRHNHSFCVMMLDIDHFKRYNDTFGHLAGDRLLTKVASILKECFRDVDYIARYGGEEFLVMLPESDPKQALQAGQRARCKVSEGTAKDKQLPESVTISVGLATFPDNGDTPVAMILSADAALYEAKRTGRNRLMIASGKPKIKTPVA